MTRASMGFVVAFATGGGILGVTRNAGACAVCAAGDKTLPANGSEQPFAGRLRATLDGRAATFAALHQSQRVVEMRGEAGAAYAITADVLVSAQVPVLHRTVESSTDAEPTATTTRTMLGDAELRVSHLAWQSAPSSITRRLGAMAGTKLPTAPNDQDAQGRYVQTDLQPGCGSITPFAGLSWTMTSGFWSLASFAALLMPFSVREGPHTGDSLRVGTTLQLQPTARFATRLGTTARFDATGDVDGETDLRSGGSVLYVTPEIVASPIGDVVISAGASFPTVQALRGYRVASPVAMIGIGIDL